MTLSEIFEGLTEDKFCTEYYAYDEDGNMVSPTSDRACSWCSEGWMIRQGLNASSEPWRKAKHVAAKAGYQGVVAANDAMGYEFVRLLRKSDAVS